MSAIATDPRPSGERPSHANPKQWLLHKLSKKHGALSLHVRPQKSEKPAQREDRPGHSRPFSPSRDSSSTDSNSEEPSSPTDVSIASLLQQEGEFGMLYQYILAQHSHGDKDVVQDMQDYIARKQALYDAASDGTLLLSPTHSRQSSFGTISSRSAPSEMSDEQLDDWLDRPEDADAHRFRKLSAGSESSSPTLDGAE